MDLKEIRSKLPEGPWRHNSIFEQVDVAADVGFLPSEFWALDDRDKAFLIARARIKGTMRAWEDYLHDKELVRKSKSKGSHGYPAGRFAGSV